MKRAKEVYVMSDATIEDLMELAEKINDKNLKQRTKELLQDLEVTNESMDYERSDLEDMPCWIGGHHYYEGGLVDHIYFVTNLCIEMAENFEGFYGMDLKKDSLISAALLHDLAKQFIIKNMNEFRNCSLDHEVWVSCELYSRNFPEKVIEIIMGHGGETTEPNPKSDEARILHHADSLDAELNQEDAFGGGAVIELQEE